MVKKTDKLFPWLAFLGPLAFYYFTLAPTVMWGDSADLALKVHDFILDPAADGHPLFIILGRIFNWFLPGELAVNLNFMCAIFAALTVLFVYLSIRKITGSTLPALAGSVALTVSHSFWMYAVVTEVYTINGFFIAFLIWILLCWRENQENNSLLYWGAFVFGLSLTNHMLIGLFGVAVLFILATQRPKIFLEGKQITLILFLFGMGAVLYWGTLLYWTVTIPPTKTAEIVDIATGRAQHRSGLMAFTAVGKNILLYIAYLFYQFPFFAFILGFTGFYALYQDDRRLFGFIFLALFSNAFFTLAGVYTHGNANYTFYISDYVVFSIAVGYGLNRFLLFLQQSPRAGYLQRFSPGILLAILLFIAPVIMYSITPALVEKFNIDLIYGRTLPFRNTNTYFLNPSKRGYQGPALFAQKALEWADQSESVIIADFTPGAVLEYFNRIKGVRPAVKVVYTTDVGTPPDDDLLPFVEKNIAERTIYLADLRDNCYNLVNVKKKYTFLQREPIWEVQPKESQTN
jgi:hypothetical protein